MNVIRTRRRGEVVKLELLLLLLLFVVGSLDLFVIQLFHIKSYYKPFFPATSILSFYAEEHLCGPLRKSQCPRRVIIVLALRVVFAIQLFFSAISDIIQK